MRKRRGEIVHSSVWTPANRAEVNEMFTNGSTVVEICKFLGINKSTWYRWLKDPRKGDFQEAVALGIQASEAYWIGVGRNNCLLYTSPSPRALSTSRMPSSA